MANRRDILLKDDDLWIRGGDFVVGDSDLQHVYLIIRLRQGAIKQHPLIGVGEERLINGVVDGALRAEIEKQLLSDGYKPRELSIAEDGQITIRL